MSHLRRTNRSFSLLVALGLVGLLGRVAVGAEKAPIPKQPPVLQLAEGSFIAGELQDSERPGFLRWQSPLFVKPFDFSTRSVSMIRYPAKDDSQKPKGAFCFELSNGDLLYGALLGLSADQIELDAAHLGPVHVRAAFLHQMQRWNVERDLIFQGPNGLDGWDNGAKGGWKIESSHLASNEPGAEIFGDFELPACVCIELELSWARKTDFVVELGVEADKREEKGAFRLEVWGEDLVGLRETESDVGIAPLAKVSSGAGRVALRCYLDQERHRLIVFSSEGKRLADVNMSDSEKTPAGGGIRLTNNQGTTRLEWIRISSWDGVVPESIQPDSSYLRLADGTVVDGSVQGFDRQTQELIVKRGAKESRIGVSDIERLGFGGREEKPERTVQATLQDGARLGGELTKIEEGRLWITSPAIVEPVSFPIQDLRKLVVLDPKPPEPKSKEREGYFQGQGIRLSGSLVDGQGDQDASCLVWRPRGGDTASPLRKGAAGRIVYRELLSSKEKEKVKNAEGIRRRAPAPRGLFGALFGSFDGERQPTVALSNDARSLYLRTGDSIPCEVTKIDEDGLYFNTDRSEASFVPHDRIKAVEIASYNRRIKVNKQKLMKLLTLPRMQKNNPPTHIIRSRDGDYLRGRLLEMDENNIRFEVRMETKTIPRNQIARIIWLHGDELNVDKDSAAADDLLSHQVQALRSDGTRLTFTPEKMASQALSGTSDVLGACHVDVKELDQLLIGDAIEKALSDMAYQRWRLQNAKDPRFVTAEDGSTRRMEGTQSALVGQAAPDFKLTLLNGDEFRLGEQHGKIVVLDFWATWCGPCIQAMPIVDRTVRQFEEQGVQLISVNLREGAKEIASTLERLKLETTVALDVDGVVAEKYGASAIPMTVIIDREGNVARLFVGGEAIEDRLTESLTQLLNESGDKTAPTGE